MEDVEVKNFPIYESCKLGETKKVFIENWLMSFVRGCSENDSKMELTVRSQYEATRSQPATTSIRSSKSEQLDFWNLEYNKSDKKQPPKFLEVLKKMFKKKKGYYVKETDTPKEDTETEHESWCSRAELVKVIDGDETSLLSEPFPENKGSKVFNLDSLNKFQPEKMILNLQENLQKGPFVIYQSNKSPQANNTEQSVDILNRGYSEVLYKKTTSETMLLDHVSSESDKNWTAYPKDDSWTKIKRVYSTESEMTLTKQESNNKKDSYMEKIELLKRHINDKKQKESQADEELDTVEDKTSTSEVKSEETSSAIVSTKKESVEDYSELTKDLTGAKYLKEHDRRQWEGRNKEMWFRFSTLIKRTKYAETVDQIVSPTCKINSGSTLSIESYLQNKECRRSHQYSSSLGASKTQNSFVKSLKSQTTPAYVRSSKKAIGPKKLEDFFAKDQLKGKKEVFGKVYPNPTLPYYRDKLSQKLEENCKTQIWHETINQVRETMKTIGMSRGPNNLRNLGYKCYSKNSLETSGCNEKEEVSTTVRSMSEVTSIPSYKSRCKRIAILPITRRFKTKE